MSKSYLWSTDIDTIIEAIKLAKSRGVKPGESYQKEFLEVIEKKKSAKCLGTTDKDIDLMTGNMREEGLKVLNLKEINRRKK